MKTGSLTALLALNLAATAIGQAPKGAAPTYPISGPFSHQNLAVFLIHGKDVVVGKSYLTLQEALEQKKIVVHETGTVGELAVENLSTDREVFIQAGDIVKGGRQDRVLGYDLVVSAGSGKVPITSFCVEHSRWQGRGTEDAARFSESSGQLPGKALRLAVRSARDQGQVWDKVREQQNKLAKRLNKDVTDPRSRSSLQLTLENADLQAKVNAYMTGLEKHIAGRGDVVGVAFTINGRIESAEIYGSGELFRHMWPKVLRAAAIDAFTEHRQGRRYEPAETEEITAFLADSSQAKPKETEVNRRMVVTTRESAGSISMETRDRDQKDAVLHRSYIAR